VSRLPEIPAERIAAARNGDLRAIDHIIIQLQPVLFNLAIRMLGHREDARDACQEILLKVVTHLGAFRGEAAFSTWVYQIARNHLMRAKTQARETPAISFESLQIELGEGLALHRENAALTPEDKAAAREIAVGCTQGMLMTLDREQRLAWLLDVVFGLPSEQAADVLEISAPAYRQRLSRARREIETFMAGHCGLVSERAACRCEQQVRAVRLMKPSSRSLMAASDRAQVARNFESLVRMSDAASVFRAHPDYSAPESMIPAIRSVLSSEGFWTPTQGV
jgi:RNA polymerase sigma factor (sigma-70 family)